MRCVASRGRRGTPVDNLQMQKNGRREEGLPGRCEPEGGCVLRDVKFREDDSTRFHRYLSPPASLGPLIPEKNTFFRSLVGVQQQKKEILVQHNFLIGTVYWPWQTVSTINTSSSSFLFRSLLHALPSLRVTFVTLLKHIADDR